MSIALTKMIIILIALIIFIMIGVYIYNDAKRRDMNAPFWVVIYLIFTGGGLIAYLIVRGVYPRSEFPKVLRL